MTTTQAQIIGTLGTKSVIDVTNEIERRSQFLQNALRTTGAAGFVLGLSGGADSTLTAYVARHAIDAINSDPDNDTPRLLHGIMLPENAKNSRKNTDLADARAVHEKYAKFDKLMLVTVGRAKESVIYEYIQGVHAGAEAIGRGSLVHKFGNEISDTAKGNIAARLRMVQLYTHAAENNLLVVGTDNAAEQLTGFYTKHGDGAYDLNPLQTLTKRQVFQILRETGAPKSIIEKAPAANLSEAQPGRTDEEELGFTYNQIDDFLENKEVAPEVAQRLVARYDMTAHKRNMPQFV